MKGVLAAVLGLALCAPQGAAQTVRYDGTGAGDQTAGTTTIVGMAWKADNTPYPGARLRLRDVGTGRTVATTTADQRGEFRFEQVRPGAYVVELLSDGDSVLALSELLGVTRNETLATFVRLSARAGWFDGFFSNAAVAAIAAASSLGVTAVGSNGLPVSPQ